jgi:GTP-binding protein
MLNWFVPTGKPIHILLTKSDKLSRGVAMTTLAAVRREISRAPQTTAQLFSSTTGAGIEEAERVFGAWLRRAVETAAG